MAKSEYGRGLATCLFMFLNHENRLDEAIAIYARLEPIRGLEYSEGMAVMMWANGATDHLYDLKAPARLRADVRKDALAVRSVGLDMGHGFRRDWTMEEARALNAAARSLLARLGDPKTLDEAMALDRSLGLRPDAGEWSCPTPHPRRDEEDKG